MLVYCDYRTVTNVTLLGFAEEESWMKLQRWEDFKMISYAQITWRNKALEIKLGIIDGSCISLSS